MKLRIDLILSLCLLFPALQLGAVSSVKLKQISTDNGLLQSNIRSLMQDNEGYLWIGSQQGVNRYDGYRVTSVESPDNVFSDYSVDMLFQDSTGTIWIGSNSGKNFQLDTKSNSLKEFKLSLTTEQEIEYPVIFLMAEDNKQDLWISTFNELLFYDRKQSQLYYSYSISEILNEKDSQHIFRTLLVINNFLFVATSNGLYAIDTRTKLISKIKHTMTEKPSDDQLNVKSLLVDNNNNLLVGTVEGLTAISLNQLLANDQINLAEPKTLVNDLNIWEIIEKDSFYWLATDRGLYQLNKQKTENNLTLLVRLSETRYDTSDDDIVRMIEDREGNLWLGSRADGVFKWRPPSAIKALYRQNDNLGKNLSSDIIISTLEADDKKIWVGTQNGLNIIDPNTKDVTQVLVNDNNKAFISGSSIYQIISSKKEIWLNTGEGIKAIDSKTYKPTGRIFPKTETDIFNRSAFNIRFFDDENMAITNREGIYLYNIKTNQVSLLESTKTSGDITANLGTIFDAATGNRETYFVSGIDRLVKFNRDTGEVENFHQINTSESLRAVPSSIYRNGDELWVAYPGLGIYILDANSGKELKFLSEDSLNANSIMDLFNDNEGNVWATTNEGLIRINKTNFNAKTFDSYDGFPSSEFSGGSFLKTSDGEFYLGSIKGLVNFSPKIANQLSDRVISNRITDINLLSKTIPNRYSGFNDQTLILEHDDFGLNVEFSALILSKPEQVKYKYWFEGDSQTSPTITLESELFLATVEEGNSTLFISAIDYETGLETEPSRLHIISKPPIWASKIAYALYLFLAILIVWINVYRHRKRTAAKLLSHEKLKRSEEQLTLAVEGGNIGLWDWHAKDNYIFEPRVNKNLQKEDIKIHLNKRVAAIHPEDRNRFQLGWEKFLAQKTDVFDLTYRLKNEKGLWAWYRDLATVSAFSDTGEPVRVTGTFTDVTIRKQERDKLQLFSTAFENIRDIVLVIDGNKNVIAVNQAFYNVTEFREDAVIDNEMHFLRDSEGSEVFIETVFKEIELESHWNGEGILARHFKQPLPVLINATQYIDDNQRHQYVFALTDISEQKLAENKLKRLANYDSLTSLPNRALLMDRITHALAHCRRKNRQIAICFVDLDRFKQINDTLGHDIGDLLLINVAQIIQSSIRQNDTVARLGGDEFVVVLEDLSELNSINQCAKKIIDKMSKPIIIHDHQVSVSPSIGIATFPNDGDSADELLKNADIAMYHAKSAGRNTFQYFEHSMNQITQQRLGLENQIREGIADKEFYLAYQPQYSIDTGKIKGVEALARWKTKDGQLIPPYEFIPIAEDIGLIISMTEQLIESALEELSQWHDEGIEISLAVNLSARHLHHYDFVNFIDSMIQKYHFIPELLEFELTESILMKDMSKANKIFGDLAERGIELALDDFGTGYSSLKYLNQLPINKLKIDRSFVQRIGSSPQNDTIIKTIISLARSLGLKTVAEGIETKEQLEFVTQSHVDFAQGYYFSKPVKIDQLNELLKQQYND